jgi:hypothetical protein
MELSRRDALAALGAAAAGGGAAAVAGEVRPPRAADRSEVPLDTLVAAAEVLYPSAVEEHREFVETYVGGRVADRPAYRRGLADAAAEMDAAAREWEGAAFADLSPAARDRVLRELGLPTAEPDPDGPAPERIRYYVVNDLLYALYTSPTGGRLVGIENPPGHPGGTTSYQRGPRQ